MRVETTGLRELRQNASELVRRVEAGETVTVTVSGREVAQLVPVSRGYWRTWVEIAAIFDGPADPDWSTDRDLIDQLPSDPFAR